MNSKTRIARGVLWTSKLAFFRLKHLSLFRIADAQKNPVFFATRLLKMPNSEPENLPLKNAKGGRPTKDADEKRSVRLSTYVTEAKGRELKTKLRLMDKSVSDFIHDLIMGKEIGLSVRPSAVKKLRADIGQVMNNINQIARKVNQGTVEDLGDTNLQGMYDELAEKLDQLDEL